MRVIRGKREATKKLPKILLILLGVLALAASIWAASMLFVFNGTRPYVPDRVYSADGSKVIIPTVSFDKL